MEIATVLNVHNDPFLVLDTLDSIKKYMTDNILLVKDGASHSLNRFPFPVSSVTGFNHGCPKSPYRNVALGLKLLAETYEADWYCYMEYDCLVGSDRFRKNLEKADEMDVWMLGSAGRVDEVNLSMISSLIGSDLSKSVYYLLGCCQFFSKKFMLKLMDVDFFDRFLSLTNQFTEGFLPGYNGYDLSEHMYPTLARFFGGNIGVFSTFQEGAERWHGSHQYFPMRFRPELDLEEGYGDASLMHPLKSIDHPIRKYHREKRNNAI